MTAAEFASVTGQSAVVEALCRAVANDEVGHAFLLNGPPGVGQRDVVDLLAAGLNCPRVDGDGHPCGTCATCRRIARGTHPAVVRFDLVGAQHLVEHVREQWIPVANRTLTDGVRRVVHVVAAERMNEAAQNAFLKVLEEPPPSTVWVLDAQSTGPLLDTIISRCRQFDLRAWSAADLAARAVDLGVQDADRRRVLVRAAQGSPARLAAFVHDLWAWTCPTCGEVVRLHGVVQSRWPTTCANPKCADVKAGAPPTLRREDVPETARQRHLRVVARFRDEGAVAVGRVAREVTDWADERVAAVERDHQLERDDLVLAAGAEPDADTRAGWDRAFRQLPPGIRNPVQARHKRELRQGKLAAVEVFLDDFGAYLRDLVAVQAGADAAGLVNLDAVDVLRRDAEVVPTAVALGALGELPRVREAVVVHSAQPQLQLEALLMPIFVAVYGAGARVAG